MAEPKIAIDILVNCQSATNQLKKFNKELNNTVEGGKKASNWLAKGFGRFIGAYFSVRTAQNIFNTGRKIQLLERSIVGLTKSTQDWEYLKRLAHDTGNSLNVVANGYKNFYAAANMAGFNKNEIQTMFSDMTISTRAIGASSEQTRGALLALEQMISKGVVSMEELRRQLGNAVPGAFEIGAKAMNMTTKEFNEFVKTGQLASAVFVPRFIAEFKRQYIGGFKEISQTIDFATGQLKESWEELTFEIMKGELGKGIAKLIRGLDRAVRGLTEALKILSPVIRYIVQNLGTIFWLLAPIALGGALTKLVETLKVAVTWLAAGNLQLSKTQIMLFRAFLVLALIQEILAFFTPMDGALETAILGKDQSWIKSLGYILSVLLAIDGLMGFKALRGLLSLLKKIPIIGAGGAGARQLMLNLPKAGATSSAVSTAGGATAAGVVGAGLLSALTVRGAKDMGIDPMSLSPYGAAMPMGMPHQITLTKDQPVQQSIMYAPQYQIDATTMTPEQLMDVILEKERNFWTRMASPVSSLTPSFSGGK